MTYILIAAGCMVPTAIFNNNITILCHCKYNYQAGWNNHNHCSLLGMTCIMVRSKRQYPYPTSASYKCLKISLNSVYNRLTKFKDYAWFISAKHLQLCNHNVIMKHFCQKFNISRITYKCYVSCLKGKSIHNSLIAMQNVFLINIFFVLSIIDAKINCLFAEIFLLLNSQLQRMC